VTDCHGRGKIREKGFDLTGIVFRILHRAFPISSMVSFSGYPGPSLLENLNPQISYPRVFGETCWPRRRLMIDFSEELHSIHRFGSKFDSEIG
jgi:hypothetical protein